MTTATELIGAVLVAVLGSKIWDFIASRMKRKDEKEDKQDAVLKALEEIRKDVTSLSDKVDENAAVLARTHILRFNDELINNIEHTQEYFIQQLQDIDTYEEYCESHPGFKNTYAVMAIENIQGTYKRLQEKGAFQTLKEE
jgi:TRAP-type uncharacterized transport system substrate-binding protein